MELRRITEDGVYFRNVIFVVENNKSGRLVCAADDDAGIISELLSSRTKSRTNQAALGASPASGSLCK